MKKRLFICLLGLTGCAHSVPAPAPVDHGLADSVVIVPVAPTNCENVGLVSAHHPPMGSSFEDIFDETAAALRQAAARRSATHVYMYAPSVDRLPYLAGIAYRCASAPAQPQPTPR